jgi:hypothetical protein
MKASLHSVATKSNYLAPWHPNWLLDDAPEEHLWREPRQGQVLNSFDQPPKTKAADFRPPPFLNGLPGQARQ